MLYFIESIFVLELSSAVFKPMGYFLEGWEQEIYFKNVN